MECLRIDIPCPVHTRATFLNPVQAAGTAVVFVEVYPEPAVECS